MYMLSLPSPSIRGDHPLLTWPPDRSLDPAPNQLEVLHPKTLCVARLPTSVTASRSEQLHAEVLAAAEPRLGVEESGVYDVQAG